jgi:hypothetical protein
VKKKRDALTILANIGTDTPQIFDYSLEAASWTKQSATLNSGSSSNTTQYLYIGFDKSFDRAFVNILTPSSVLQNRLTAQYFNGVSWNTVPVVDETLGFATPGFLSWNKPADWAPQVFNPSLIDSATAETKYFIRVIPTLALTNQIILSGIGLLFCEDDDIAAEDARLLDMSTATQRLLAYEAAKNDIVSEISRRGNFKQVNNTDILITAYDLDIEEVKPSAIYAALSKLYFNFSEDAKDVWAQKSHAYNNKYEQSLQLSKISIDKADNGTFTPQKNGNTNVRITR